MPKNEVELLAKINRTLPTETLKRYQIFQSKRTKSNLTKTEFQELSAIVEQKELLNAERLKYLGELAAIRKKSLREVMRDLECIT